MDPAEIVAYSGPLTDLDTKSVGRLVAAAKRTDGVAPLSEQPLLWLQDSRAPVTHLLVRAADELAGYAQLDLGDNRAGAELVVHPLARCHGVGSALLSRLGALAGDRRLLVWAHGGLATARSLAKSTGLVVVRELLKLRLDLRSADLAMPKLPNEVTLRNFTAGDEAAWLAVNARAFADHPEQGRISRADLDARIAEPWFDHESFLLAMRGSGAGAELVGFIWLKVPPVTDQHAGLQDAVGEVYVLGVDPSAQGQGLGSALTSAGLAKLAELGVHTAELYVESTNQAALKAYTTAGFSRAASDLQLGQPE